jgi:hypothetical protein
MALRQIQLTPEADSILDSVAESCGGDAGLAVSELLIAYRSIESFLDELETENATELSRQRDRSAEEFAAGKSIPWDQIKLEHGL